MSPGVCDAVPGRRPITSGRPPRFPLFGHLPTFWTFSSIPDPRRAT